VETTGESQHLENTPIPGTIEPSNSSSPTRSHQSVITFLEENDRDGLRLNIRYIRRRSELLERSDGQFENRLLMLLPNRLLRKSIQNTISSKMEIGVEASLAKSLVGRMVNLLSKRMRRVFRSSKSRKVKRMGQKLVTSPMVIVKRMRNRQPRGIRNLQHRTKRLNSPNRSKATAPTTINRGRSRQVIHHEHENEPMSANLRNPTKNWLHRSRRDLRGSTSQSTLKPSTRRPKHGLSRILPMTKVRASWTICEKKG